MRYFTLLELDSVGNISDEAPMVGTIVTADDLESKRHSFNFNFLDAVSRHFDLNGISCDIPEIPRSFDSYIDIEVDVDGAPYVIRVMETFFVNHIIQEA